MPDQSMPLHAIVPSAATAAAPAPAMPAGGDTGERVALSWSPPPGMLGLSVKNFLLRIVTLGIYGFWGKTEVRRRIWSAIRINGEPLQYTGTGKELFLGFLVVFGAIILPTFIVTLVATFAFGPKSSALAVFQLVLYVAFFYLIGVGIHRATRYRLARTNWRGIRGGLDGSSWGYAWTYFWTGLVLLVSLGWAAPWRSTKLQGLISNGMRFGDRPFSFGASSGPLYGPFLALWLSGFVIMALASVMIYAIVSRMVAMQEVFTPGRPPDPNTMLLILGVIYGTLIVGFLLYGMVSAWYRARMMNHFAAHTSFEGARFSGTATGRGLIWLTLTNYLMVLFTLGLLVPVAQARAARYFAEHIHIDGSAPLAAILQRAGDNQGRGEGLAQMFDVDAF